MHKSNYDKASEVAMGKLRPKPDVSITISMKGGGGLSSLGEFPIIRRFMGSYTDEDALGPVGILLSSWFIIPFWIIGMSNVPRLFHIVDCHC